MTNENSQPEFTCAQCHWFENINNLPRCCFGPSPLCGGTDASAKCELWAQRRPPTNYQVVKSFPLKTTVCI